MSRSRIGRVGSVTRDVATLLPWGVVGIWKGQDEATPNGCGSRTSKVVSASRALIITFALTDERQRCRSGGCERSAVRDTTMRDYIMQSGGAYRTGGAGP